MRLTLNVVLVCFSAVLTGRAADPQAEIASFSKFAQIPLEKLAGGDILGHRGSLMTFRRGISTETCFVVMQPPEAVAKLIQEWDPSPHQSLQIHVHRAFPSTPTDKDFEGLRLTTDRFAMRRFVTKTLATKSAKSDLQMSREEARQIEEAVRQNAAATEDVRKTPADLTGACWQAILKMRAEQYLQGGPLALPPYEMGTEPLSPAREIASLLNENKTIAERFAPILNGMAITAPPAAEIAVAPALNYWELFEAVELTTVNLGAIYVHPSGECYRLLDCQYFASDGYYASLILYEIWPVQIGGKPAALIWRGDFLSAPTLAITKGMERMAYGNIMLQEIKKAIRYFQQDAAKSP